MNVLVLLSCASLFVMTYGTPLQEAFTELFTEFEKDVGNEMDVTHDEGHCKCSNWGCWCYGTDDNVKIHAYFSVDQTSHKRSQHTVISAAFFVGNASFTKIFEADRFEDFCETVEGKRFCFRIDVEDIKKNQFLKGCLRLSRPHKVDMGCFKLPLAADSDDMTSQDSDSDLVFSDDISDDLEYILRKGHCMCCEHGCSCEAVDDGYKVVVILSVDETRNDKDTHVEIDGNFIIGNETFSRRFEDGKLESFCQTENGTRFCFQIRSKKACRGHIHGCMRLTRPKRVNIGCFKIPLLASFSDDNNDVDAE